MYNVTKHLALAAILVLPATALVAQNTTYHQRHTISHRRHNEQARIRQGYASGQVTNRGAANLERHQQAIHNQEHADRAADGGHLTAGDRHQLAREQDRQSARVYRDKHNAATQPGVEPR